jgi:DNA-binding transcriptional LysR family regulator
MSSIEIRHLRYFIAVAEALNFSRAAERLGTAQPSLSQQIRGLEREIGVELFGRGNRRVTLTAAGAEFLAEARELVAHLDRAISHAREAGRGLRGELRVAYSPSTMMSTLPLAIRAYRVGHPDVRITLRALAPTALLEALGRREIDVGVLLDRHGAARLPDIDMRRIGSLPFAIVLPEGHPLAGRHALAIEEIGSETLILYARHLTDVHDIVVGMCRERGFTPARIQEVDRVEAILGLVAAGEGVSIVPRVYESLLFRGVEYAALSPAPKPISMVVARNSAAHSTLAEAFVATCRSVSVGKS